jgi:hypothetical protein
MMKMKSLPWRFLVPLLLVPQLGAGFLVLQLNLKQLTSLADRVFVGQCLEVKQGRDRNGRPVQFVTYEVRETLKGNHEDRVTFKQLVVPPRGDEGEGIGVTTVMTDLPDYKVGEENVIFLSAPSELGLTAPIGLKQGKFTIMKGSAGKKQVINGVRNRGLMQGLKGSPALKSLSLTSQEKRLLSSRGEKLPLEEFVSLVKKIAEES